VHRAVTDPSTFAGGLTRTYMHTCQADLEKAERDLAEDQKVSEGAGWSRACANLGVRGS